MTELFVPPPQGPEDRRRARILKARRTGLYAAPPGEGPAGETCGTCRHARRMSNGGSKRWAKCRLVEKYWTGGAATDCRLRTPACGKWEG